MILRKQALWTLIKQNPSSVKLSDQKRSCDLTKIGHGDIDKRFQFDGISNPKRIINLRGID